MQGVKKSGLVSLASTSGLFSMLSRAVIVFQSLAGQPATACLSNHHTSTDLCVDLQMKRDAEANKEPPVYTGKWSSASKEEVEDMLAKGAKPAYRFRVPKDKTITVPDAIRGDVSWNTDTLGDFIILRSDGSPVYNFCVAIDDALMKISHVIRAEEHLPNTLRQVGISRPCIWCASCNASAMHLHFVFCPQ